MIAKEEAKKFVAYWRTQVGSERSRCHQFWDSLLGEVLGVTNLKSFIEYEQPVYFNDGTTGLSEPEIVSRLFERYAKLMDGGLC